MLDIKFLRENPEIVKENIKKKFQDEKLPLVDEVIELDVKNREAKLNGDNLRSERKNIKIYQNGLKKSIFYVMKRKNKKMSKLKQIHKN